MRQKPTWTQQLITKEILSLLIVTKLETVLRHGSCIFVFASRFKKINRNQLRSSKVV